MFSYNNEKKKKKEAKLDDFHSPKFNEEDKTKLDEEIVNTDNYPEEHDNFSYILEENKIVDGKILIDCSIWLRS